MSRRCSKISFATFLKKAAGFLFLLLVTNSCKETKKKAQFTIGFSQCVGSDLWRETLQAEMKIELSLHPGTNFIYADAENDSKKQIAQVRAMLKQGIDLLIISPNEAQPLTEVVDEIYNKGIPVVVIDRKTSSGLYTAYVGADNYQLGKMAGEYIGSTYKGKINLVEVMGLPGSSSAIERDKGLSAGIKNFKNVQVTSKIYGNWLQKSTETQLLTIKPVLTHSNVIFAHNDNMATGARNVINSLHLPNDIKVIGVDALPGPGGGLKKVADRVLNASLLYPTGGKEAIVTAFQILNGELFSRENTLQSQVIDSTNVQLMKMQYSRITSQQNDILKQQSILQELRTIYNSQQVVLDITIISLVLAIVFGGLAFYSLIENRKINKSLETKNDEILLQRNQLIEISAKAAAATEARLNFFTNVSHEFRTPLTLMLLPLQDMLKNDKLIAMAGRSINTINQNAYRLLKLVNQLIDYRKIEVDKQVIKTSHNNLVDFIKDIIESFKFYGEKQGINLRLISPENEIKVWFDINMLDKVFFNLISNGLKFSNIPGEIQIVIRKDEKYVHVDIQDNGIGMVPEELSKIFDQFYQADNSPAAGSGIGLSLSKEIVLLHHGKIEATSKKWQGTVITVSLPLGDLHLNELEKAEYKNSWPDLNERSKLYKFEHYQTTTPINEPVVAKQKEHSILIVEDNPDLLEYLVAKFSTHFEIFQDSDGYSALAKAYEQVPDLILSDVVLPGLSGKSLSIKLKSDVRTSHIPIVLLTAQNSVEQQISGIQSMADLYITKPFNFDYVLATIKNLINNRVILKEHFTSDISSAEKLYLPKSLDKKFVNDFAGIVEQNLANDKFNVDDISKLIGVSRIQLYRKVKALLGCNITDYILNRRLKKAKYLLNNENFNIAEITYMVGFSNPNYFATVFKGKYGCTPSEFKKNKVAHQ